MLAFVAVMAALIGWLAWNALPERVRLIEDNLVKTERGRRESMSLAEVDCILFHYHAVVGFVSAWEFVSREGRSLHVDGAALGIRQVVAGLERRLPGFSKAEIDRLFASGDVEDSIEAWRAPRGHGTTNASRL